MELGDRATERLLVAEIGRARRAARGRADDSRHCSAASRNSRRHVERHRDRHDRAIKSWPCSAASSLR